MLMQMAWVIAISSLVMEITLVHNLPFLRKIYLNGFLRIKGPIWNVMVSIALSALLGAVFTAQGLVVVVGAGLSGLMSDIYFRIERAFLAKGWTYSIIKENVILAYSKVVYWSMVWWRIIKKINRIITWPFRFYQSKKIQISHHYHRINNFRQNHLMIKKS